MPYIAYLRVSTKEQGISGLGLDAQQAAIEAFAKQRGDVVAHYYREIESGKRHENRPQLKKALGHAKRSGYTLLVAKLDRLGRNVAFLSAVMEAGCEFACADLPQANRLLLHIMSAVGEAEAKMISERTRAALQALKARGVKLGSARPEHWKGREQVRLDALVKARAARIANLAKKESPYADLMPTIESMERDGKSLKEIAAALNSAGHTTSKGSQFKPYSVGRVLGRY